MRASVLITTYNKPEYLRLALLGYTRQTTSDFEILVCDDGSEPETRSLVEDVAARTGLPIRHVWQEDRGYRRGRVLNLGAARSEGDLLIFTDQDCIPHRCYVEEHLRAYGSRAVGYGRVVRLGEELSARVTGESVRNGALEGNWPRLLWWALSRKARAVEAGFYLGRVPGSHHWGRAFHQLFGGNFSCPRKLFVELNGFNEDIEGWGREDTELGWRFQHAGCEFRNLKFHALLYHLWHPPVSRDRLEENDRVLDQSRASGLLRCERGLSLHMAACDRSLQGTS